MQKNCLTINKIKIMEKGTIYLNLEVYEFQLSNDILMAKYHDHCFILSVILILILIPQITSL